MTTIARLEQWKDSGLMTGEQFEAIARIVRKDRFSIFFELNALLYLGVVSSLRASAGSSKRTSRTLAMPRYFLSNAAAVCFLLLLLHTIIALFGGAVESPNIAFDYVLYAGCLVFGLEIAYLESRFHLLNDNSDLYLLGSALMFFALAYRFDNRLVLSPCALVARRMVRGAPVAVSVSVR